MHEEKIIRVLLLKSATPVGDERRLARARFAENRKRQFGVFGEIVVDSLEVFGASDVDPSANLGEGGVSFPLAFQRGEFGIRWEFLIDASF